MDTAAIFTGIAAILTAAGGTMLVIHEFRRRDRRSCQGEIDELSEELHLIRGDFADFKRWAFMLHQRALEAGVEAENPPAPRPLAPVDPDGIRVGRHVLRRFKRTDDGHGGAGGAG